MVTLLRCFVTDVNTDANKRPRRNPGAALSSKITRRRFLGAAVAGGAWIALIGTLGCERSPRARAIASPAGEQRPWTFRSRPKLGPPAVEVTEQAHDTAPGYIFVAPQAGAAGQGGSLIV